MTSYLLVCRRNALLLAQCLSLLSLVSRGGLRGRPRCAGAPSQLPHQVGLAKALLTQPRLAHAWLRLHLQQRRLRLGVGLPKLGP